MMNGDTLMPTFQELQGNSDAAKSFFAEFFLYTYLAFFITCVLNMFIMIIETGFDIAHKTVYGVLPAMIIEHVCAFVLCVCAYIMSASILLRIYIYICVCVCAYVFK